MSDKIEFLREELLNLPTHTIHFNNYPNTGGCDAYGDGYAEYELSLPQIFKIISAEVKMPKLFKGLPKESVPKQEIRALAKYACFPDGEFEGRKRLPSVSIGWDDAVDDDGFLREIVSIITEFIEDKINEEEVTQRFEWLTR